MSTEHPTEKSPSPGDFSGIVLAGRYRLTRELGSGGMGVVWEAEQREPVRRKVAVKVIKRGMDTGEVVARFEAERQALALMNHPNVARVFDAGETPEGRPFFVMEYVQGEPITSYCDRHRLTTRERIELFAAVCEGVQHAHHKGVIHRDLKPGNVLVTIEADRATPKIIDFGVAKATSQHLTERTLFTELGQLVGTPEYMSPEQADPTGLDIDTRTDVYALGVLLYQLLAGALPFDSQTLRRDGLAEIQRRIREDDPPRPSTRVSSLGGESEIVAKSRRTDAPALVRRLRGDLDWITMKALEKDRTRRYDSPTDLAADLRRYLDEEPVLAAKPSASYRVRKFVRRHRLAVFASSAVLVALMVGLVGTAVGLVRARQAEARAVEALGQVTEQRDRAEQAQEEAEIVAEFLAGLFAQSDPSESLGEALTARQILDRGAERMETELVDRPLTRARMLEELASVYQALGIYDVAERQIVEAVDIRREEQGDAHPDTARAIEDLASLHFARGEYERAEELHRQALEVHRAVHGEPHADVAHSLSSVGSALVWQGNDEEGERFAREALEMARQLFAGGDEESLDAFVRNHANALHALGRGDEAEPLYVESVELCRAAFGDVHPQLATALDNLAIFYDLANQPEKAEPLYRESLEMLITVYGDRHVEVAQTMGNVAGFLVSISEDDPSETEARLEEAESLYQRALDINREYRPDHPFLSDCLDGLSVIRSIQGRNEEAVDLVREALDHAQRKLPADHPKVVSKHRWLGALLLDAGRSAEALPHLREALEHLERRNDDEEELEALREDVADAVARVEGRP